MIEVDDDIITGVLDSIRNLSELEIKGHESKPVKVGS